MPRPSTSRDTRTALLDCAEHIARARGLDGFSYADLAEVVGIRKASIHYHFPSKAELSSVLMARYADTMARTCTDIDARCDRGGEKLVALIELYLAALNGGRTLCLCVAFINSRDSLSDEVVRHITAFRTGLVDWTTRLFEQGARDGSIAAVDNPASEAHAVVALLEGAQLAARAEGIVQRFEDATALLRARCIG